MSSIQIRGVKQNNLKDIDVDVELGSFTVVCGPSGSGKSSLAFETLYAEGQRRYIESLSNYARQFLNKAPQPDIEDIKNIPPSIAIEQKNFVKTSRSTVGTTTEVIDYMRLLYEKIGVPYCPNHNIPVRSMGVSDVANEVLDKFEGKRGYLLAPITKKSRLYKGKKLLGYFLKEGFLRIFTRKALKDIDTKSTLPTGDFEVVVDRLVFDREDRGRLVDSIAQGYQLSRDLNKDFAGGRIRFLTTEDEEAVFSEESSCDKCGYTFPEISSRLFNFSNPVGACPTCNGFGNILSLSETKIIPNPNLSLAQGAIYPFSMPSARSDRRELLKYCEKAKIDIHRPWKDLPAKKRQAIWEGNQHFYGVEGAFEYLESKKYKMHVRVFLSRFKEPKNCPDCKGTRLRKAAHHVLIKDKSITQATGLTLKELYDFINSIELSKSQKEVTQEIYAQLRSRLEFLVEVGVHYLTLDRETRTLSGGEYQRINLASQLGMGLSQILYVLDEPTVGLHSRDNDKLIHILKKLQTLGNTLVVVEHDKDVIRSSDRVIEMGPGSGHLGGEVVFNGETLDFLKDPESLTSQYLATDLKWTPQRTPRPVNIKNYKFKIEIDGCKGHNLKNVKLQLPLNRFVCVTGVSGSGKSSLISQTLYPAIHEKLTGNRIGALDYKSLEGTDFIKSIIFIDQKPVGKTSRSNPVTYMKVFDEIRKLLASTEEAKIRGYSPGYFSLNVDGGRCPTCKGIGYEVIDMQFMDEIRLTCEDCNGTRYQKPVFDIKYRYKHIGDILNLTVKEAMEFFVSSPSIRKPLSLLREVGLGYLTLGQSAQSLSGGESQRLKIAKELNSSNQRATLYVLDEPTTGLHFREIEMLLDVLNKLIEVGGSVVVIEHNLDVIRASDYVVEVGPEAGEKGGKIMFAGTPEELSKNKKCATAKYLQPYFGGLMLGSSTFGSFGKEL